MVLPNTSALHFGVIVLLAGDKAVLRPVKIGNSNSLEAEVLEGLEENDRVILYPCGKIHHGTPVVPRSP